MKAADPAVEELVMKVRSDVGIGSAIVAVGCDIFSMIVRSRDRDRDPARRDVGGCDVGDLGDGRQPRPWTVRDALGRRARSRVELVLYLRGSVKLGVANPPGASFGGHSLVAGSSCHLHESLADGDDFG